MIMHDCLTTDGLMKERLRDANKGIHYLQFPVELDSESMGSGKILIYLSEKNSIYSSWRQNRKAKIPEWGIRHGFPRSTTIALAQHLPSTSGHRPNTSTPSKGIQPLILASLSKPATILLPWIIDTTD